MHFLLAPLLLLIPAASGSARDNVLLVVLDDVGVDRVAAYREHPDPGHTPTLDRLAAEGVLFRNVWANPYCSATRATLMTGRYGFRTGIGRVVTQQLNGVGLSLDEVTLPEVLARGTGGAYRCALIGKWHLGAPAQTLLHPLLCGFDLHAGTSFNLDSPSQPGDYFSWVKTVNGVESPVQRYATTEAADDAIAFLGLTREPWFLCVAFNAAHDPRHAPPADLHTFELSGDPDDTPVVHTKAMIEAMDTELGRILAAVPPAVWKRTTVVVLSDNGTAQPATDAPFPAAHAKGSLFEGGVNVPLIVAGARVRVPGSECRALVNSTDIFATVAELAGVDPRPVLEGVTTDSVSIVPYLDDPARPSIREIVYAEKFRPNGPGPYVNDASTIRDERYKLIRHEEGEQFFDLRADPFEQRDLLDGVMSAAQSLRFHRLRARLEDLRAS